MEFPTYCGYCNSVLKGKFKYCTFEFHSSVEALFKSASRALFASGNCDGTSGPSETHIVLLVLNSALEEAFAALTREDAVVETGDLVAANGTRAVDELLSRNARLSGQ